jgi:hypothetical protein
MGHDRLVPRQMTNANELDHAERLDGMQRQMARPMLRGKSGAEGRIQHLQERNRTPSQCNTQPAEQRKTGGHLGQGSPFFCARSCHFPMNCQLEQDSKEEKHDLVKEGIAYAQPNRFGVKHNDTRYHDDGKRAPNPAVHITADLGKGLPLHAIPQQAKVYEQR